MQRSQFLKQSILATVGIGLFSEIVQASPVLSPILKSEEDNPFILGPIEGYSPNIGILVSEMRYMRNKLIHSMKSINPSIIDLDFLIDQKANSIGALLWHLAATDSIYHVNTFENRDWNNTEKTKWDIAMNLGSKARTSIKGNNLDFYLNLLQETREATLSELKKRDDKWFLNVEPHGFANMPTNTFCKWFHVTEHEAHHLGQIELISKRLPSAKDQ